MTIIEDETRQEVHPLTPAAIQRSADHRYTFEGRTYPGVTSILGMLDKSGPLVGWAKRKTAEIFLANMTTTIPGLLESVGPEGVIRAMTSGADWQK